MCSSDLGGRLVAEGTAASPIHFTRAPGSAARWGGIVVNGGAGSPETRIAHAHIAFNGTTAIHSTGGTVWLDHLSFGSTDQQYVSLDASSFVVAHCVFPSPTAGFEPCHGTGGIKSGGHGIFYRNYFGRTQGYNDEIDFTGGNRPSPIVQFIVASREAQVKAFEDVRHKEIILSATSPSGMTYVIPQVLNRLAEIGRAHV